MNFLAHAYLSFGNPELIVGNLIADTVKGRQIDSFPAAIRQGIVLHRAIDSFTDSHPVVKRAKHIFDNTAGRYGGSFLDVAYDHFLALDQFNTPDGGWESYAETCYSAIESFGSILPSRFCSMYMYMKKENWLSNYGKRWLIEKSFDRMTQRANYLENNVRVYSDFESCYDQLKMSYDAFFPDLKKYVLNNYIGNGSSDDSYYKL